MAIDKQMINEIVRRSTNIVQNDIEVLITNFKRQKDTPLISLPDARRSIENFKDILKLITFERLVVLPHWKLAELNGWFKTVFTHVESFHQYEVQKDKTLDEQQRQLKKFFNPGPESIYKYLDLIWPIVVDSIALEGMSGNAADENLKAIAHNLGESEKLRGQLESILTSAQSEITKAGVSKHATIFFDQSETHKKSAQSWKVASISLIVINVLLIIGLFFTVISMDKGERIELGISGILIISLVSYCLVLSVKNFFSERHNQIINKHKANCLDSYTTFIEGASDEVRATILQFTTQTIFSPYNPGFLTKDLIQSPSPILEILRTVHQKS